MLQILSRHHQAQNWQAAITLLACEWTTSLPIKRRNHSMTTQKLISSHNPVLFRSFSCHDKLEQQTTEKIEFDQSLRGPQLRCIWWLLSASRGLISGTENTKITNHKKHLEKGKTGDLGVPLLRGTAPTPELSWKGGRHWYDEKDDGLIITFPHKGQHFHLQENKCIRHRCSSEVSRFT